HSVEFLVCRPPGELSPAVFSGHQATDTANSHAALVVQWVVRQVPIPDVIPHIGLCPIHNGITYQLSFSFCEGCQITLVRCQAQPFFRVPVWCLKYTACFFAADALIPAHSS